MDLSKNDRDLKFLNHKYFDMTTDRQLIALASGAERNARPAATPTPRAPVVGAPLVEGANAARIERLNGILQDKGKGIVIQSQIGSGGMGEVYLATQESLSREVAVKALAGRLISDGDVRERFIREARILASLESPHIVNVLDVVEHQSGNALIIMEYLRGKTLHEMTCEKGGKLTFEEAKPLLVNICEGLHASHEKGVIHRDLKPENVFVLENGRTKAKLVDFGIARVEGGSGTQVGAMMGTPGIMAPEQINGGNIDPRTDIYQFGVLAYYTLTGQDPFLLPAGCHTMEVAIYLIAPKILNEMPKAPCEIPGLDVPRHISDMIMRCLAKDPKDRYENVGELIEAMGGAPTSPRPASPRPGPASPKRADSLPKPFGPTAVSGTVDLVLPRVIVSARTPPELGIPPPVRAPPKVIGPTSTLKTATMPTRSRRGLAFGVLGVVSVGALVIGAAALFGSKKPEPAVSPQTTGVVFPVSIPIQPIATTSSVIPPIVAPSVAASAPLVQVASTVTLTVKPNLSGVEIKIDGNICPQTAAGCVISLEKGSTAVRIKAAKIGYNPLEMSVIPDKDQDITLEMKPVTPVRIIQPPASGKIMTFGSTVGNGVMKFGSSVK